MPLGGFGKDVSENESKAVVAISSTREGGFVTSGGSVSYRGVNIWDSFNLNTEKLAGLASENKTLRQIDSDISAETKVPQSAGNYSGSLKLADDKYLLRNVKLAAKADFNTILDADIARPLNFTGKCNIKKSTDTAQPGRPGAPIEPWRLPRSATIFRSVDWQRW